MANITLGGNPVETSGNLPSIGSKAPNFKLTVSDLSTQVLSDFEGHKVVLNIFPSVDTGTCAQSVRTFNKEASETENTKVLCISRDLPFAQARFCGAEGIDNVVMLSDYPLCQYPLKGAKKFLSGGADLSSTAYDYFLFCKMMLNKGELDGVRILKEEALRTQTERLPNKPGR